MFKFTSERLLVTLNSKVDAKTYFYEPVKPIASEIQNINYKLGKIVLDIGNGTLYV